MRRLLPWFCAIGLACLTAAGAASAQPAPGSIAPPTREEVTPPASPPTTPDRPQLRIEGDIERSPCPLADPAYAAMRVTINNATFNNLKGVSPEELRPVYAAYLGQDRPVAAICDIRDAVATYLRGKGYLAAVQVPTQRIENGEVRFEVLFARIVAVRVRGEAGRTERLIASYLAHLEQDEVFNRFTAERYLLLARDLPGMDVRMQLRPAGTRVGELIGDVTVVRTPVEVTFNAQNYAGRDTGRFGGQLQAQFQGLTGLGDRTTIGFYSTADFEEQKILQASHEFRAGGQGLTLGGRFAYAWTQPDLGTGVAASAIKARTLFANAEAAYPFVRRQHSTVRGALGFDYVDQKVRFGPTPISRDRLRVVYLRLDGEGAQPIEQGVPAYRYGYSLELRRGIGAFNASRPGDAVPASRIGADATATLVRGGVSGEVQLGRNAAFAVRARGQYAFDPLLSFEQYSGGNYTIGRGYAPGTIIGDSGVGVSAEFKINRLVPAPKLRLAVQPFIFVDSAWTWNKRVPGTTQRLTSVGGGMRASLSNRARLDLTLAVPTNRAGFQAKRGDTRLLFSLTTKLFPWGDR